MNGIRFLEPVPDEEGVLCQVCGEDDGELRRVACQRCGTIHHLECWEYRTALVLEDLRIVGVSDWELDGEELVRSNARALAHHLGARFVEGSSRAASEEGGSRSGDEALPGAWNGVSRCDSLAPDFGDDWLLEPPLFSSPDLAHLLQRDSVREKRTSDPGR